MLRKRMTTAIMTKIYHLSNGNNGSCEGDQIEGSIEEATVTVSSNSFLSKDNLPGQKFCYLVELRLPAIPEVFMMKDKLCDLEKL